MELKHLAPGFERWAEHDSAVKDGTIVDITSGGLQKKGAQPMCLCDDQDCAIELWHAAATTYGLSLPAGTKFKWIEKPSLDRWQITITDAKFTHRLVSDRYAVFARIAIQ